VPNIDKGDMRKSLLVALLHLPLPLLAQSFHPSIEAGYGVTGSRLYSGEAVSAQGSVSVFERNGLQVRAELLHQRGTAGSNGPRCDRLGDQYCLGTSDRNRITALGAALHIPLGMVGRFRAYAPVGIGLYNRRTATTEAEGPIAFCTVDGRFTSCAGNPPFRTVSYNTRATVPGYNVGFGLSARFSTVNLYAELRAHDLIESNSMAAAIPISVGIRF